MQNYNLKFKIINFALLIATLNFALLTFNYPAWAVSPTPKPTTKLIATPSPKVTTTPSLTSAPSENENVKEIRDAIKEKVDEIKEKIEKKAYVGTIVQITDSTLTLSNFRGKQRVRLLETTTIIGTNKKEIKTTDLSVDDKIIALGTMADNEILEAKRVIVVIKPKVLPPKRLLFYGNIAEIDSKNLTISLVYINNQDKTLDLKIESTVLIISLTNQKVSLKFKDLKVGQKIVAIYPQSASSKAPLAKVIFLLP